MPKQMSIFPKTKKISKLLPKELIQRIDQAEEIQKTLAAVNASKMIAILVLRNQGWGESRLRRFSEQFNDQVDSINRKYMSLSDIGDTIFDETGLSMKDLRVE